MKKYINVFFGLIALLLINSCGDNEDSPRSSLSNTQTIEVVEKSASYEESMDLNLDRFIAEIIENGRTPDFRKDLSDCSTVTTVANATGYVITIVFDEGGCEDNFGNTHEGTVVATVTTTADGYIVDKTLNNYTFNDISVAGTVHSVIGYNDNDDRQIFRSANLVLTNATGIVNNRTSAYTITLIEGGGDMTYTNDVYSVSGGSTNALSTGTTWTVTNISAVIRPGSCNFYAVSGQKTVVNLSTAATFFIEYGDGECDGVATITLPNGTQITYNQY